MEEKKDKIKLIGIMQDGFGIIPRKVMKDKNISIKAKALYAYMCSLAGNGTQTYPTRKKIIEELGISLKTYYKILNELIENKLIKVKQTKSKDNKFKNNIYTLIF